MDVKETVEEKKYALVAPDGGWGYMIWIALTINLITTTAFMSCFGMIYNELYIEFNMDSTNITLLNGIASISISLAGFITGPMLSCLSIRKLGMISTIILNLGTFAVVFIKSKGLFFLTIGILQAFGSGALLNLTFTTLNQYFVKKRILTVAVTQTITAVVSLFTPQFVKWSSEEYGFRGTLILITGIYMQTFVAITLMQPVEWHMKKIKIGIISEEKDEFMALLKNKETGNKKNSVSAKLSDIESVLLVAAEKSKLNNSDIKEDLKRKSVFREMFSDFLDIPFLKSFLLSNASIGLAIAAFSDVIFMIMLPQALYFMEWTEGEVAWALSLNNFGDLIIKIIFILFNNVLLKFGCSEIYLVGLLMSFVTKLGMLWSDNPTVMLTFIVMMGMSRSVLTMLYPLVIGDAVDKEKFTSAMGIFMLLYGMIFLVFGPLIGIVRDLTNSYGTAFYIITSCYGILSLFWSIELLYKKNKGKRVKKTLSHESA